MKRRHVGIRQRGKNQYIRYRDQFGRLVEEMVGPSLPDAIKARAARLTDIERGRFNLHRSRRSQTLRQFVYGPWRNEVAIALEPSTRRGYETALEHHLLPHFGEYPLPAITRAAVKGFIAQKARQQR